MGSETGDLEKGRGPAPSPQILNQTSRDSYTCSTVPELSSSASTPNLCMKAISHPVRPERSRGAAKSKDGVLAHSFKMDALVACAMRTEISERQSSRAHSARYVDCVPIPFRS